MPDISNTIKAENGTEVYTNVLYNLVDQYKEENNIDDILTLNHNTWNDVLYYIYDNFYALDKSLLKLEPYDNVGLNGNTLTNHNKYDDNKLLSACNSYIRLCYRYNKRVTIIGFAYMTGIDEFALCKWKNLESSTTRFQIYKKLDDAQEQSVVNLGMEKGRNPIIPMAILNTRYGFNSPYQEHKEAPQITEERAKEIQQQYQNAPQIAPPESV